MAEQAASGLSTYKPVDIQVFRHSIRDIHFDVYLKLSEDNMAHVFSKATGLDYKRLAQYIQKGVKELFVKTEDEEAFNAFAIRTVDKIFSDPNVSNEKKIATLLNMTEQNMAELFTQLNINEDTANSSQKVVKNYVNLMTESPKTLAVILKLVSHGEYLYYHSIAVAIFSILIAKATGQFNQRTLELVGMGGFLHDIGCTKLPEEITSSAIGLTPIQWEQMRSHPKLGLQMLEGTTSIPDEVRYIVYQHHEEPGGHGYPNGLQGGAMYYPAKIVSIADAFSALISKRPFRPAYTVEQAIQILKSEVNKRDKELVRLVSTIFMKQVGDQNAA